MISLQALRALDLLRAFPDERRLMNDESSGIVTIPTAPEATVKTILDIEAAG
jgi:hypothetical protein